MRKRGLMASSNLPPLDFTEEQKNFEAKAEKKEIQFPTCTHTNVTMKDGWLRCSCGAGWTGTGVDRLYKLLTKTV